MRIISLTSIPPRFAHIQPTLDCLAGQGADDVRLYVPASYRRFPDWQGELPRVPPGVTIVRCDEDLGPATKILPACRDFRATGAQILFCDDDCIVPEGWAQRLFDIQALRSGEAVAGYVRPATGYVPNGTNGDTRPRAWQLPIRYDALYRLSRLSNRLLGTRTLFRRPFVLPGYGEVFFGVGGVVVRPEFFDDTAWNIPEVAWPVDDIWLSANLARKQISIYCPWLTPLPRAVDSSAIEALADSVFGSMSRQVSNRNAAVYCQKMFGIWM